MSAKPHLRRVQGDGGQVTTALLVVMIVVVLAVVFKALIPLAAATDQRSRAQTAADAAALAAVDAFGERVRDALKPGRALGYSRRALDALFTCLDGKAAARDYARRNGATFLEERWSCRDQAGRTAVQAGVRSDDELAGGERSEADAYAQMDLAPKPCELSDDPDVLKAAYAAAVAAAAEADAAAAAAQEAAADAQEAVDDALEQVEQGELDPDIARELIEAAEKALDKAEKAAGQALDDAAGPPPAATARLRADCGQLELELELDLAGGALTFTGVKGGTLKELLEPRLVSEGRARDV